MQQVSFERTQPNVCEQLDRVLDEPTLKLRPGRDKEICPARKCARARSLLSRSRSVPGLQIQRRSSRTTRTRERVSGNASLASGKGLQRWANSTVLTCGRVPETAARIFRKLDEEGLLGRQLFVVGIHSLFAYGSRSGVLFEAGFTTPRSAATVTIRYVSAEPQPPACMMLACVAAPTTQDRRLPQAVSGSCAASLFCAFASSPMAWIMGSARTCRPSQFSPLSDPTK
jgi:hypothetical protein